MDHERKAPLVTRRSFAALAVLSGIFLMMTAGAVLDGVGHGSLGRVLFWPALATLIVGAMCNIGLRIR
jgi:hypothetical protein